MLLPRAVPPFTSHQAESTRCRFENVRAYRALREALKKRLPRAAAHREVAARLPHFFFAAAVRAARAAAAEQQPAAARQAVRRSPARGVAAQCALVRFAAASASYCAARTSPLRSVAFFFSSAGAASGDARLKGDEMSPASRVPRAQSGARSVCCAAIVRCFASFMSPVIRARGEFMRA